MKIETLRELVALMKKRRAFYSSLPDSVGEAFMDNPAANAMESAVDLLVRELCSTEDQVSYCEWLLYDFDGGWNAMGVDGVKYDFETTDQVLVFLEKKGLWEASRPCHR